MDFSTTTIVTTIIGFVVFAGMINGYRLEDEGGIDTALSILGWGLLPGIAITFLIFLFFHAPIILGLIIAGVIWLIWWAFRSEKAEKAKKLKEAEGLSE